MAGATIDLHAVLEEFKEQGFVILENFIEPELLDEATAAMERLNEEVNAINANSSISTAFVGRATDRVRCPLGKDPVFQRTAAYPPLLEIMAAIFASEEFLLSEQGGITLHPGGPRQGLHTDDMYYAVARPHSPITCVAMWALTDFTEANGATRLVPGSHRLAEAPATTVEAAAARAAEWASVETVPAVMSRGSVAIYDGGLWHGGGANTTKDEIRIGMTQMYGVGWLRPQENYACLPLDQIRTFEPRLQQLIGFGTYQSVVGNYDGRPPAELVLAGRD